MAGTLEKYQQPFRRSEIFYLAQRAKHCLDGLPGQKLARILNLMLSFLIKIERQFKIKSKNFWGLRTPSDLR